MGAVWGGFSNKFNSVDRRVQLHEEICEKILNTKPTLELWKEKRNISSYNSILDQAFDFLFFNRTNFSGIYTANPIGGMQQKSDYPIDCRWNPQMLCKRIVECSKKLQGVKITNLSFDDVILAPGENVFMIIDPPYYVKGDSLYPVSMSHEDHFYLASLLTETNHKFLLTIDDCPEVRSIYQHESFFLNQESWKYSISQKRDKNKKGKELFISNFPL
ncbi:DNA adenine methylase [Neobacillus pocheonensis]|uniref:DNA adenine methylase n=1 Tax=Neobacillus pocheonensis TaxID=363869 RepID=UPI003D2E0FE0